MRQAKFSPPGDALSSRMGCLVLKDKVERGRRSIIHPLAHDEHATTHVNPSRNQRDLGPCRS